MSCSEGSRHVVRSQSQDGSSLNKAVTRRHIQQHSIELDEKEVLSSSWVNSVKINEQIVQHQFEEKRSDQRAAVYIPCNRAKQEQINEDSYEQSPHGAIRRQALQQPQSKNKKKVLKKVKQRPRQLRHGAISHKQSQNKQFAYLNDEHHSKSESNNQYKHDEIINRQQQFRSESKVNSGNELKHRGLQQERCKHQEQIQLTAESHEKKSKSKEQHSVESDQSRPGIKQVHKSTASPKRILPKLPEPLKYQSGESKQKEQEYTLEAKHVQLSQQQLPNNNVKLLQGHIQQIEPKQVEDPKTRRDLICQLQVGSPFEVVDSDREDIYLKESPELPLNYPDESGEILYEGINVTESTDLHHQRFSEYCMGIMGSLEDHERKVIIEFCHLLEKSKQLFNGLR